MRILYLISALDGGGAALPLPDVISVMRGCGHSVRVAALMPKDGRARAGLESAQIPYDILGRGSGDAIFAAFKLLSRLRGAPPDLLWTSVTRATLIGQIIGKTLGIPVVSWQHNAFLKPANALLLRRTRSLTRHWIADSETVATFATETLCVARDAISVWPLFIAKPDAPQAAAWTFEGPFRVGSLGRLHANKGYDVLIRAAARLRDGRPDIARRVEFVVAGDGPERARLTAQAKRAGVANLRFVGFEDNPRRFLASLHAYVQPSHHEGLCIAAHEAMLAGLPVVATRVGELARSILPGQTGMFAAYGDADGLANTMAELVTEPARAAAIGRAARARVLALYGGDTFECRGRAAITAALAALDHLAR